MLHNKLEAHKESIKILYLKKNKKHESDFSIFHTSTNVFRCL